MIERVAAGVVLVRGHQQLVAGMKLQRTEHGVHAAGRVRYEGQVGRRGSDEGGQLGARGVEQRLELADEKANWLPFHPSSQFALPGQDHAWRCAERAVVEKDDLRVEQPMLFHAGIIPTILRTPSANIPSGVNNDRTRYRSPGRSKK